MKKQLYNKGKVYTTISSITENSDVEYFLKKMQ